jgi:hypothetical protein
MTRQQSKPPVPPIAARMQGQCGGWHRRQPCRRGGCHRIKRAMMAARLALLPLAQGKEKAETKPTRRPDQVIFSPYNVPHNTSRLETRQCGSRP